MNFVPWKWNVFWAFLFHDLIKFNLKVIVMWYNVSEINSRLKEILFPERLEDRNLVGERKVGFGDGVEVFCKRKWIKIITAKH